MPIPHVIQIHICTDVKTCVLPIYTCSKSLTTFNMSKLMHVYVCTCTHINVCVYILCSRTYAVLLLCLLWQKCMEELEWTGYLLVCVCTCECTLSQCSNVSCDLYLCLYHVLPPSVVHVGGETSGNAGKDRGTARVASPALAWSTAAASGGHATADSDEM